MPSQTSSSSGEACKREKYWNELNAHERVDRMRGIVKTQNRKINELEQQIRNFIEHSHDNNGEITVPLKTKNHENIGYPIEFRRIPTPEEDENVYF